MKRISVNFEELQSYVGYANTILSDKSVEEKLKNLIFVVSKEDVKLVAYSAFTFSRTTLASEIELDDVDSWSFQVKASEVNKIISSFSSLYKTKVSSLDFEEDGVKIKVVVHEESKDEENSHLNRNVDFYLENAPIMKKVKEEIMKPLPEESDVVSAGDLLLYLDSLFPLINNDAANGLSSKIQFADDYVFILSSTMASFMVNKLPDAFKNITITYSSANFLKKLVEKADTIEVAKDSKYICVQNGNTEAFLQFQRVKVKYNMHIEKRSKDCGVVIDRLYLKDVLKRMSNMDPDGVIRVSEDELVVSNKSFEQNVPIIQSKNADGVGFNIFVPVLEKIILGKDDVYNYDIFMYFVETKRGYLLYLSDKTGSWFSTTQVVRS